MKDFLVMYIGWVIPGVLMGAVYCYALFVKRPLAMTGKYAESRLYKIAGEELLQLTQQALHQAGFKGISLNEPQQFFFAKAGFSILSWGELIQVDLINEAGGASVKFTSVCRLPLQVVDWGKNKHNACKFLRELDNQIMIGFNLKAA
jgi:hypothetical protein